MSLWLIALLVVLATHRVTRVITRDSIPLVATPREAFVQRWGRAIDDPDRHRSLSGKRTNGFMASLAYLWECDWCASIYVAAIITYLTYRWTPLGDEHWVIAVLLGLAASSGTGLIAQREPD